MKKYVMLVVIMGMASAANAKDDCTPYLLAYMSSLEFAASSDPSAKTELDRMKRLRAEHSDCDFE